MRLWAFVVSCVIVFCGSLLGFAQQQQTGPATLENLLGDEVTAPTQRPVAVDATDPAATGVPAGRIQGAVARPKDGVQHPDLDAAWAEYDKQIETAAKAIEQAIEKELSAAAAAGDLDAALKWKTAGVQFRKDGSIPEGLDGQKPQGRSKPRPAKSESSPQSLVVEAQGRLARAYEAVEKDLVKSLDLERAKQVRSEKLLLPSGTSGVTYLSDMKPRGLSVPAEGEPFQPGKISVGGVEREHGIFLVPPSNGSSTVSFAVPQGFSQLIGSVAMNDSATGQKTPLTFKVLDDRNSVLWRSNPVFGRGKIQDFQVEVSGTSLVKLVVECPGDWAWAHGAWIEPRFILANPNKPPIQVDERKVLGDFIGLWQNDDNKNLEEIRADGSYIVNRDPRNQWSGTWVLDMNDPKGPCVVRQSNNKTLCRWYVDPAGKNVLVAGDGVKIRRMPR